MTTTNTKKETTNTTATHTEDLVATSKATLGVVAGLAGAMGIWGATCLASALAQGGIGNAITGYMTAVGMM